VIGFPSGMSAHPCHAHQPRVTVNLSRARAAFACLTIPADSQIVCLVRLDLMNRVKHDHSLSDFSVKFLKFAAARIGPPYVERTFILISFHL
jgi:hypothetical protein